MMNMFKYAAANAAVRANIGRLIPDGNWEELLTASGAEDFISAAGATIYRGVVAEQPVNLENIEKQLRQFLSERFRVPIAFLWGGARALIDWFWRPFEINNLIILLRGMHNRMPAARIRSFLISLKAGAEFNWHVLSNTASVKDAIARIKISPVGRFYAGALENAYHEYSNRGEIFILEIALYLAYYRRLQNLLGGLTVRDREDAQRFIGSVIDTRNILWIYRFRIFFHLEPEVILGYTLPRGGRVNDVLIQKAATGASLTDILSEIWGERLPELSLLEGQSPSKALVELENIFRRYLHKMAMDAISGFPLNLATILAYLVLIEDEVDDLITVVEGIESGWKVDDIRRQLIGSRGYS